MIYILLHLNLIINFFKKRKTNINFNFPLLKQGAGIGLSSQAVARQVFSLK